MSSQVRFWMPQQRVIRTRRHGFPIRSTSQRAGWSVSCSPSKCPVILLQWIQRNVSEIEKYTFYIPPELLPNAAKLRSWITLLAYHWLQWYLFCYKCGIKGFVDQSFRIFFRLYRCSVILHWWSKIHYVDNSQIILRNVVVICVICVDLNILISVICMAILTFTVTILLMLII